MESADELDDDLRAMYAAERALPPALDAAARARVLDAVAHATVTAAGFSLATVIIASLISAVVGAGLAVGVMVARDSAAPSRDDASSVNVTDPIDASPAGEPIEAFALDAGLPAVDADAVQPRTKRRIDAGRSNDAVDAGATGELTTGERNLIDRARAALARDKSHEAMLALAEHERTYPDGTLREDREYLAIVALVAQGKRDLAAARAASYRARYPQGMYAGAIARVLAE